MEATILRSIQPADNASLAKIVRESLTEFGANKPGTVYYDDTTDHLFELFQQQGSAYFVTEWNHEIMGGGGIFPSAGLPDGTCELVKMYLKNKARGKGIGRLLIEKCIDTAKQKGYTAMYIETMPELKQAVSLYEKFGFKQLKGPLGNTGHFGCDVWMLRDI
jgi:putative acetyltransferase